MEEEKKREDAEIQNLVTIHLADEVSQVPIQYYSDLTLGDLADYLDQQKAKRRGTYYFCSPSNDTVYSLSTVIGDLLLEGEKQLALKLTDSTPMHVTLKFDDSEDQVLQYMPDDTIRTIKQDLSDAFNFPPSSFKIKFGEHECDDNDVLYNIGIRDGSEITYHLTIRTPVSTLPMEVDGDTTFQEIQQCIVDSESELRYSHISITDINLIPVLPHSTVKQYLEEHPETEKPYTFQVNVLLDGD